MRKHVLFCALSSLLLLPVVSAAQERPPRAAKQPAGSGSAPAEAEGEAKPEGSATIAPGAPPAEGNAQPGSAHTVEKGDTLWDLSQKYLGSPWYWPKVWSYNPEIANPHWIYPGNVVRFFQGGEETPTQVEVGQQAGTEEAPGEVEEGAFVPEEDERVSASGPIGYVPKKAIALQATGFVTPGEVEESGVISGSFSETEMLSPPQQFYARFKGGRAVKLGDAFVIFRSAGEVVHPITHQPFGFITKIVGAARVDRIDNKTGLAVCSIEKQFDDIRRGDNLGPLGESLVHSVAARPNEREIKGAYIVGSTTPYLTLLAEHHIVIIDKGADDGVKPGNIFSVWRARDGIGIEAVLHPEVADEGWPREDVGACMAFEVKSKATTCLVTRSLRDLAKGDNVEMRVVHPRSAMR